MRKAPAKKETTLDPPVLDRGPVVTNPNREYIAATVEYPYFLADRALPRSIDDAERDFGDDIYDRLMNDAIIRGHIDGLRIRALAGGVSVVPALDGDPLPAPDEKRASQEEIKEYEAAKELSDFCRYFLRRMGECTRRTMPMVLWEMFEAHHTGHKLAEVRIELATDGPYRGKQILTAIKPKPRKNYVFVLDEMNNFRGVIAKVPGVSILEWRGIIWDVSTLPNAIDPTKLWVLTFGGKNGDPRGESCLRAAYDPWFRKQLLKPEEVKTGVNFGGGKITGTTGDAPASTKDPVTGLELAPEQHMANQLAKLAGSGGVAAFSKGSQVQVWYPTGDGAFFDGAFRRANEEIVIAIAKQTRSTLEAKHGSKADSETAQDKEDAVVGWLRDWAASSFELQVLKPVLELNYTADVVERFLPKVVIGTVAAPDFATDMEALSKVGFKLGSSQYRELDRRYGLPERDEDDEQPETEGTPVPPKKQEQEEEAA